MTEFERTHGIEYREQTTDKLKWELWAFLQSRLHESDILDRSKDERHKAIVRNNIRDMEIEIAAIRAELKSRKGA